jgi:hypothetical protein
VGQDAHGIAAGRPQVSDEAWVSLGDELSDEDYNRAFKGWFGIEL